MPKLSKTERLREIKELETNLEDVKSQRMRAVRMGWMENVDFWLREEHRVKSLIASRKAYMASIKKNKRK